MYVESDIDHVYLYRVSSTCVHLIHECVEYLHSMRNYIFSNVCKHIFLLCYVKNSVNNLFKRCTTLTYIYVMLAKRIIYLKKYIILNTHVLILKQYIYIFTTEAIFTQFLNRSNTSQRFRIQYTQFFNTHTLTQSELSNTNQNKTKLEHTPIIIQTEQPQDRNRAGVPVRISL